MARFGVLTERSVGTSDDGARGASRAVVDRYVAAVRARDCASIGKTAYLSDAIRGRVCRGIVASVASLTRRLRADERAEAAYLGGNGTFSFYGVETARPEDENSTVVVMRVAGDRHVVMDVAPSPTAAEVKRITESFKLQQRNSGSMEPSPEEQTGRKAE